jgi:hypothetical protein
MPEKLSDRERAFFPEIDAALRREGLMPVESGKGDLHLDFSMSSGPTEVFGQKLDNQLLLLLHRGTPAVTLAGLDVELSF